MYSDNESHKSRTHSSFNAESCRFWTRLRKTQFINPNASNRMFQNISGESILSEELKNFMEIAHRKRIKFIREKLSKKISWHSIPITCEEANLQKSESSLTKL
ncbi:hypothetical protein Glove_546g15 [Diversispora epigaea]|uniref:Uncharacterized protein n=1 Tax=Diversispora epigaea TaxID=1348612 RepID=A0A397GFI8_9GLOM|nr:hypothetical protein Glove_546g15 [Diversispora epigaea]